MKNLTRRLIKKIQPILTSAFVMTLALPIVLYAQHSPNRPPADWAAAGGIYWLVAAVLVVGILGFMYWSLKLRGKDPENPSSGRYHALGLLIVLMTVFTLALYLTVATEAQSVTPTQRAWDWQPGETLTDPGGSGISGEPYRGYQVYLAQGCTYCHTLYVRPEDVVTGWSEGFLKEEDVSQVGDFVHYPYTLLGTQRSGPDLSVIGRRIPDMGYQIGHLKKPRKFKPNSIMPNYDYLSDTDLRDLAAYLVSLGNSPEALKAGTVEQPVESGLSELALEGQNLYRSQGCVGCHSIDGSPNAGPTWLGLYGKTEALADGTTVIVDDAFLIESIVEPGATLIRGYNNFMPAYKQLSEAELAAFVAYIQSLNQE